MKITVKDSIKQPVTLHKDVKRIFLNTATKKQLKNWKKYWLVDEILTEYYGISKEEALENAKELSELVTHLKDSLTDKRIKSPPLKSRIHVLHNECLRLYDMAEIPAITKEEVQNQISNVLEAFNALNTKLNAVFAVRNLENELELDPDFEKILTDSIRVEAPLELKEEQTNKSRKKKNVSGLNVVKKEIKKIIK